MPDELQGVSHALVEENLERTQQNILVNKIIIIVSLKPSPMLLKAMIGAHCTLKQGRMSCQL